MCTTNSWNNIAVNESHDKAIAVRSDGIFFEFYVNKFDSISDFIINLDSYKDCKCSAEALCPKHQTNMEKTNAR